MQLAQKRILLTGATGGLGQVLAKKLAEQGGILGLVGRDPAKLQSMLLSLQAQGATAHCIVADMTEDGMVTKVLQQAAASMGEIDVVMLNAGILDFVAFEQQTEQRIAQVIHTNVTAVIQLARAFVAYFKQRGQGHFVFVGSIFGSLGFPHFATYSASKFAVHGFSQALRRELVDSKIGVTYIAPRAIDTPMNDERSNAMWQASGQAMDSAETVANRIVRALIKEEQEVYIGQPQSFFAWLNGVAPKLVNIGLKQQARLGRKFL